MRLTQRAHGDNRPPWKAVLGKNAWKPLRGLHDAVPQTKVNQPSPRRK